MPKAKKRQKGPRGTKKRGPEPMVLQIDGPWKAAVGKALGKGKPPEAPKTKRRSK